MKIFEIAALLLTVGTAATIAVADDSSDILKNRSAPHVSLPPPAPTPVKPPPQHCPPGTIIDNAGNCLPLRPYRRPIILQQTPPAEAADTTPTSSDWEGCRKTKLNQLNALQRGDTSRANHLDEWLWKNCRYYSDELRDIEQDDM